jgi:Carboxypeptidase regulatory-like domain/TonB dependent receptor
MCRALMSLACFWLCLANTYVLAQQSASSGIVGQVTDATQAALPGATVTVTHAGTNAQRTTVTDEEGRFSFPNLPAATYQIKATLNGFTDVLLEPFPLRFGEVARRTIAMSVATLTEAVTVQAEAPLLQSQSASVGQVIAEKQLEELPIADRNVLNLVATAAGVSAKSFIRGALDYGRREQYVTVDGGRDSDTSYAADGIFLGSLLFNNMALNPPSDSLQEVSLQRSSFSTEFGQGQAVVSMVTKSGSNRLSAAAFENFRHHALNARNYFAPRNEPEPEFSRNRFGVSLGGPLLRNRAFAFGSYERLSANEEEVHFANVPDPNFLRGNFSSVTTPIRDPLTGQPFPGNIIPQDRIVPFAAIEIPAIPAPNITGPNNYRAIRPFTEDTDSLSLRFDEVLSGDHTLFQRYLWFDSEQAIPSAITDSGRPQVGRNLALGHTWVMPRNFVNEIRFGYAYSYHLFNRSIPGEDYLSRNWIAESGIRNLQGGTDPRYYGRPGTTLVGWGNAVPQTGVDQGATDKVFSISSATSKATGAHNLRFGVQAQYRDLFMNTPVNPQGAFTFNGRATGAANNRANAVADFLLGYCSICRGQYGSMDSNYVSPTVALFLDDVWQATDKITIQAGVRWEYLAPWHEIDNRAGSVDPVSGRIGYHKVPAGIPPALAPLIIPEDDYFPAGIVRKDLNNWSPRLGLVYNLTERTVIRSGFGIYYQNLEANELQFSRMVLPFAAWFDASPTGSELVNVDTLFPDLVAVSRFPAPFSLNPDNVTPYTTQWNVNVQHQFLRTYLVEVAYTGSAGRKLWKRYNMNQPSEGTTPLPERLPFPHFDPVILTSSNDAYSDFNGISFRIDKRYSGGLFFSGFYQNSKMTDNNSGQAESNDTAFRWNKDADFSLSRYHQRHRSSITFGYELPFGPTKPWLANGGVMAGILGGWQVSGAVRMQSGVPFTITGSALQNLGGFVPNRMNFAPGREGDKGRLDDPTQARWFDPAAYQLPPAGFQGTAGRNTLIGPAYRRTDLSVARQLRISGATVDLRGEIFNLLNTTNFGNPAANISNTSAGVISSADDARYLQLVLRVRW